MPWWWRRRRGGSGGLDRDCGGDELLVDGAGWWAIVFVGRPIVMFAVVWVGRAGAVVGTWVIWSSRPENCVLLVLVMK